MPRAIGLDAALDGLEREAMSHGSLLPDVREHSWDLKVRVGKDEVDARWICRHAVHDTARHLMDVERVRSVLFGHR
jgi:hypothetical protein